MPGVIRQYRRRAAGAGLLSSAVAGYHALSGENRRALFNAVRGTGNHVLNVARRYSNDYQRSRASRSAPYASGPSGYRSRVPRSNVRPRYGASARGYRKSKRGRRVKKRRGNSFAKVMWNKLCTPLTYKSTIAQAYSGIANQRQFKVLELNGQEIVTHLGNNKPSNFLFDTAVSSTATLQDFSGQSNWRLQIDKFIWDMRIQNRSNASMELKIYECIIRHDVASNLLTQGVDTAKGFFQDAMDTPIAVGQSGSNVAPGYPSNPTGVSHTWQHPTFTPYMSNEFVEFFKIQKTHSLKLSPNEIIPRKWFVAKKLIKGQHITSGYAEEWMRGWSRILLFSWVGMPIDDGTVSVQGKAKCDLFLQADVTIKYHFLPGSQPLSGVSYTNDINSIGNQYSYNPAIPAAPLVPASDTFQVQAGDAAAETAP